MSNEKNHWNHCEGARQEYLPKPRYIHQVYDITSMAAQMDLAKPVQNDTGEVPKQSKTVQSESTLFTISCRPALWFQGIAQWNRTCKKKGKQKYSSRIRTHAYSTTETTECAPRWARSHAPALPILERALINAAGELPAVCWPKGQCRCHFLYGAHLNGEELLHALQHSTLSTQCYIILYLRCSR